MTTPLERAPAELAAGRDVWLKREDTHELGAFKWRAALRVVQRHASEGAPAIVTASTGNHGIATAWACDCAGVRAIVYAPENTSATKQDLVQDLGAELRLVDGDLDSAKDRAKTDSELWGLPFFEDGAEPEQCDAYGGIADEWERAVRRPASFPA